MPHIDPFAGLFAALAAAQAAFAAPVLPPRVEGTAAGAGG